MHELDVFNDILSAPSLIKVHSALRDQEWAAVKFRHKESPGVTGDSRSW
jgi:hypothetical protein